MVRITIEIDDDTFQIAIIQKYLEERWKDYKLLKDTECKLQHTQLSDDKRKKGTVAVAVLSDDKKQNASANWEKHLRKMDRKLEKGEHRGRKKKPKQKVGRPKKKILSDDNDVQVPSEITNPKQRELWKSLQPKKTV